MKRSLENYPTVPPQDEWGLDPIYWSYITLMISQVHTLQGVENLPGAFVIPESKRPVRLVEIVGVVINVRLEGKQVK